MLTRRDVVASAGLAFIAGARRVRAQDGRSDRPIRVLVGYPAGGGVDIVARLFAEPLKAARNPSSSRTVRARAE
jgi:tripartite-type tricarboxylate transporter receptor subunit TctC